MSRAAFRDAGGAEERERRTIIVERSAGSFGFTLQSYGIHYRDENDVEVITYVDYVDPLGQAHRAGLRSGDVILSINGQDVERADHSTLVSIIQTCPNRIRMVVLFENCVRKVELHMKYIRLQQILEQKAREYQEVCAREKSLVSRLNRARGSGSYQTMQLPSHHSSKESTSLSCVGSSKSMPRSYSSHSGVGGGAGKAMLSRRDASFDAARGAGGVVGGGCTKKNNSYLCISRGADCDCCFHLEEAAKKGVKFKSKAADVHHHQQRSSHAQRPRSFHISSCYNKDPARHRAADDRYLVKNQSEWATKAYGGYGFGYDFNISNSARITHSRRDSSLNRGSERQLEPSLVDPPYYRRSLPKSADDLLAAQFQSQCQLSPHQVRRSSKSSGMGLVQQQSLDSISFYTRPPQPKPLLLADDHHHPADLTMDNPHAPSISRLHYQTPHQRPQLPSRPSITNSFRMPSVETTTYDEGGFDEARSFRTLPMVTKRATEYR